MEPVVAVVVSNAVLAVVDSACVIAFIGSVGVLVATGREEQFFPWLASARVVCVVVTGVLAASSLVDAVDRWALVLACLGFLFSLQAVALAFGQLAPLRSYLDRRTAAGEPVWWADFERSFGRYVARRNRRGRLWRIGNRASEAPLVEREDDVERSES